MGGLPGQGDNFPGAPRKAGTKGGCQSVFAVTGVFPSCRYKNGSLICQAGEPGKYRIESKYGVHTLEINR